MNQERVHMTINREKFSSQADPELLKAARDLAGKQGRQFQSVIEEALQQYIARYATTAPRKEVLDVLGLSIAEYDLLYSKLAK
jgi:hypothetical protein